jgi:DNA (cytosine-5)-methyltransferase 1
LKEEASWRPVKPISDPYFLKYVDGNIPKGMGNPEAVRRYKEEGLVSGCFGTRHSPEVQQRYKELKQGQIDSVSRSVRLKPNGLCPTLRAGTGADKGSYQAVRPIHPTANRVITPREAARLQGFPDWFQFAPSKWHSFRQIGNSVSPILAESILKAISNKLA